MTQLLNKSLAPIIERLAKFSPVPSEGSAISPDQAMHLAISEAHKGLGFAAPNPLVGCVIVDRHHQFVASGYHHQSGFAHAEIDALTQVRMPELLKGATAYVTLEPCAHQGRTGSCAQAFAGLPLKRVVYGLRDPFPLVNGQGEAILRGAGVEAVCLSEASEFSVEVRKSLTEMIEELAEIFLWNVREQLPFVAMKVASSLDGKMALSNGESKWITGPDAREYSHYLRAHYDAVLIGRNTFVTDDPALNIRLSGFARSKNRVILLDPSGKTLADLPKSQLMSAREPSQVLVVTDDRLLIPDDYFLQQGLLDKGVRFVSVPASVPRNLSGSVSGNTSSFDISALLKTLWNEGIRSVFIEGGAQTFGSFLSAQAMQRLHLFMAPSLLGGEHGVAWTQGLGISSMGQRVALSELKPRLFGPDLYLTSRIQF